MIYLIGSLRNPKIVDIAARLEQANIDTFSAWAAAGDRADDAWRDYETSLGHSYAEALAGHAARHVFDFDEFHLRRVHGAALILPAGKSGHLELGYVAGMNKPTWILSDGVPARYDVMVQFASQVCLSVDELITSIKNFEWPRHLYTVQLHASEAMWLAGLLEGEGAFVCDSLRRRARPRPRIALQMTDQDVMEKCARLLDARLYGPYKKTAPRKPVWAIGVTGMQAAEYMRVLQPYMSARRQRQIVEVLSRWDAHQYRTWRRRGTSVAVAPEAVPQLEKNNDVSDYCLTCGGALSHERCR